MLVRRVLIILSALLALVVGACLVVIQAAMAADPNPNCSLRVPPDPLSATGLATPYVLSATDPAAGACDELNPVQAAFVEAAIIDPATGQVSIYRPLVVTDGTTPGAAPTPVTLPPDAVVGLWFGYNGDNLKLVGPGAEHAVNGRGHSLFGQFAYINAPAWFHAANVAIAAGKLVVPPLGTASDGLPCPTTRDWMVVDQDQSDNVATSYRLLPTGIAQDTAATRLTGAALVNGSDERLLSRFIDPALGCKPWLAPDATDAGNPVASLALNELSAAKLQAVPKAKVPLNDPMVLVGDDYSPAKTNLYRAGVDQKPLPSGESPALYCKDLATLGAPRVAADQVALTASPSPEVGVTLFDFLNARYAATVNLLNCANLPHRHHHHHHDNDDGGRDR